MATKKRPHNNNIDDDPDWTPAIANCRAKRPHEHSKPEHEAATLKAAHSDDTTQSHGQQSDQVAEKLEREKRRLPYIWQQKSDSFLCGTIKITVRVRIGHEQFQAHSISIKTLQKVPLARAIPKRIGELC